MVDPSTRRHNSTHIKSTHGKYGDVARGSGQTLNSRSVLIDGADMTYVKKGRDRAMNLR